MSPPLKTRYLSLSDHVHHRRLTEHCVTPRQASTEPRVGVFHQARFSGIAAASDTVGSDTTDLADLLGADWLPTTTLTEDGA